MFTVLMTKKTMNLSMWLALAGWLLLPQLSVSSPWVDGTTATVARTTTYDALNRPASITEAGRSTYYGYDLAGRALKMISGNGQVTKNVYDELGRLTNRTLYANATDLTETGVLAKFGWGHDAVSNVTAHLEQWKANALRPAGDRTTGMTYDEVNRLKTETINDPTSGITITSYEYDDANNRSSKTVTGATDPGYWTYDYNEANQLESWAQYTELSGTLLKSAGFVYDSNGNRTSQSVVEASVTTTTTYAWNAQDRLTGVTMPDGTEHGYLYDYRARRVETTRTGGSLPAQTTAIVFAGGLSLAEYESSVPAPIAVQSPTVHYLRGPDMGGGVGGMLYSIRGSTLRYSLSNGRGDIIAQSDENAALTWTASYEAYGKRPAETGTNEDKQRANSKDEDPTGLLNEGFRYRDLETGVWMSRDPAGFVDGPNLYAYVKQNPWTSFDPDGLETATIPEVPKPAAPAVKPWQGPYANSPKPSPASGAGVAGGAAARVLGIIAIPFTLTGSTHHRPPPSKEEYLDPTSKHYGKMPPGPMCGHKGGPQPSESSRRRAEANERIRQTQSHQRLLDSARH